MRETSVQGSVPIADLTDMVELHNRSVEVAATCINRLVSSHNRLNRKIFFLTLMNVCLFAGIGYMHDRVRKLEDIVLPKDNTPSEGEANNE